MKLRYKLAAGLIILGFLAIKLKGCLKTKIELPVVANITVDPLRHRIQLHIGDTVKTISLPDRPSTIVVHKDGSVTLTTKQFGFEFRPFAGMGMSNRPIILTGFDFFYVTRFDLGGALGLPMFPFDPKDTRVMLALSYNIWSNTRATLVFDQQKHIGVVASVRF